MVTVTEIIRWVLLPAVLLAQQPVSAQTPISRQCKTVMFRVSLEQGRSYQKNIGALTLKIDAQKDVHDKDLGWYFTLVDDLGRDYIYPANLPIRFNPLQILGPGYDFSAHDSMSWNRSARFLLSKSDYERIDPLLKQALWPVDSPDPENAGRHYVNALRNADGGIMELNILDSEISSDNVVRRMVLEITLTAPASFPFDPSLPPETGDCPQSMFLELPSRDPAPSSEAQ